MAFQTEQMERMRKMEQNMFDLMGKGQPVVMERPKAPDNDQSEVQLNEMMYTPTPHPPAAEATPPSNMTHSVSFKLYDGTGAKKPPTGSSAPVEK